MIDSKKLRKLRAIFIFAIFLAPFAVCAQETPATHESLSARSKDGKKLFGTAEALRLARVSSPRIFRNIGIIRR